MFVVPDRRIRDKLPISAISSVPFASVSAVAKRALRRVAADEAIVCKTSRRIVPFKLESFDQDHRSESSGPLIRPTDFSDDSLRVLIYAATRSDCLGCTAAKIGAHFFGRRWDLHQGNSGGGGLPRCFRLQAKEQEKRPRGCLETHQLCRPNLGAFFYLNMRENKPLRSTRLL
jgi:hypothetical protein